MKITNKKKTKSKGKTIRYKGPMIHCVYRRLKATDKLKPHPDNPNQHPERQVALLAGIIQTKGWRQLITISRQSGYVVYGHCRLLAAKRLGLEYVPVDYQDFPTPEFELSCLLDDNHIAELSELDSDQVRQIIAELKSKNIPLQLTSYTPEELSEFAVTPDQLADMTYKVEELRPYSRTHILLSFPPEVFAKLEPLIAKLQRVDGVEYEQGSN